ncbi:MAG: hypothetical protein WBC70_16780 [Candidatus Aminicenantales bacterium]
MTGRREFLASSPSAFIVLNRSLGRLFADEELPIGYSPPPRRRLRHGERSGTPRP